MDFGDKPQPKAEEQSYGFRYNSHISPSKEAAKGETAKEQTTEFTTTHSSETHQEYGLSGASRPKLSAPTRVGGRHASRSGSVARKGTVTGFS